MMEFLAQPKFSTTSKMPCPSWSLPAIGTCPGAYAKSGELVTACQGCYATQGRYLFKNVMEAREHNRNDWQLPDWEDAMVYFIRNHRYFRWFDSGDCYHYLLALKILRVMEDTQDTFHWLPTRMHKFKKFKLVFDVMNQYPNVCVRFSSDGIHGEIIEGETTSTIIPSDMSIPQGVTLCEAPSRKGQCASCRACWDKTVPVVAYQQHGHAMKHLNNRRNVA
jgi:hypothetical protein